MTVLLEFTSLKNNNFTDMVSGDWKKGIDNSIRVILEAFWKLPYLCVTYYIDFK